MYICMNICSYVRSFLPQALYTVWCLSKLYAHKNNCKKTRGKKNKTAQIGTNVRARVFNAELLARSQFESCDQPTRSRLSVGFLGPRANAELVPKFHVALHASNAALLIVTLKILRYTNFGLDHPVHGARHQNDLADRPSVAT
jgi:hypothetical protein